MFGLWISVDDFCRGLLVRWKRAGMVLMPMTNTTAFVAVSASIGCTLSGMRFSRHLS